MTLSSFFGPPRTGFQRGGAHLAVYLVPTLRGELVAFDVSVRGAEGRWLPWNILPYGENPYVEASALVDDWCDGAMTDLRLVDVLTSTAEESWEISLVYRVELSAVPPASPQRNPVTLPIPLERSIRQFSPTDLERWIGIGGAAAAVPPPPADSPRLLF